MCRKNEVLLESDESKMVFDMSHLDGHLSWGKKAFLHVYLPRSPCESCDQDPRSSFKIAKQVHDVSSTTWGFVGIYLHILNNPSNQNQVVLK
jgi:hypothetical protein